MTRTGKILVTCFVAALTVCSAAAADPPDRVGRLNLIAGGVSFRPGDASGWISATLNYPLTAGDNLWTDGASRAEVHLGSTAVRLGPASELCILELDDRRVRISLPQGLLGVRLRELDPDETFQIETPTMSISLLGPGSYRVEVRERGDTQATVNEGGMQAFAGGQSFAIHTHQSAIVAPSDWRPLELRRAPAADEWDRWCAGRDNREDHLASVRYVPRSMIGCEDLDWYGNWSETPEYGAVWIPSSLPVGWAPYKFGHWAWVRPWGWTWIDDLPWGFAPFHYGRWTQIRGVWVWVPGSILHRPVYAPALVVFVGAGHGNAVRNGSFRWFPLGPREVYVPPYQASRAYIQKVNRRHVQIGEQETIDAISDPPQVIAQVLRQLFSQARENGEARKELKSQSSQNGQKVRKKKKLPNGQWVWVNEWVEN